MLYLHIWTACIIINNNFMLVVVSLAVVIASFSVHVDPACLHANFSVSSLFSNTNLHYT